MGFSQRKIAGFSTGFLLLAIGIASLVISTIDRNEHSSPNCGIPGYPPLRDWIFGTGIASVIISVAYYYMTFTDGKGNNTLYKWIALWAPLFIFIWMIVGAVSLWRDGGFPNPCYSINPPIWDMGTAAVVVYIIIVFFGSYVYHRTNQNDE